MKAFLRPVLEQLISELDQRQFDVLLPNANVFPFVPYGREGSGSVLDAG